MARKRRRNSNLPRPQMAEGKRIVIAEQDNIGAVVENKRASEFFINRGEVLIGDVYLAKVENVLPSIEAAFVNVGTDKMGFLHAQDVTGKGTLKEKLQPKQKVVVQVTKEPTGHKGPRVTMEISLPGRFLVLIPNDTGVNVSRKISSSKERSRLKALVNLCKPVGVGIIVRTEAEGQSENEIKDDLEALLDKWNSIVTSAETIEAPNLLYRDQDLIYRVIREACTEDVQEIVVDSPFAFSRVKQLLQNWHMNRNIKLTLHKGSEPVLNSYGIDKEIKAALQVKVNMPSGGYLYIQPTEALTVIDVNSGKFVSSSTQDETILKTNKEAVKEIAHQLRLRNVGGMIIIDFIDMISRADKLAIMEELESALEPDKAKPQVGQLSDLGLVELTRHRQGQTLAEIFTKRCPHCQASGYSLEEFKFSAPIEDKAEEEKIRKQLEKEEQEPVEMPENTSPKESSESETTQTPEEANREGQEYSRFKNNRRRNFNRRFRPKNKPSKDESNQVIETKEEPTVEEKSSKPVRTRKPKAAVAEGAAEETVKKPAKRSRPKKEASEVATKVSTKRGRKPKAEAKSEE